MSVAKAPQWRKLPLSLAELCIDTTLRCGQSFRWRQVGDEWHCSLYGRVVSLKQDASHLHYRATWPESSSSSSPKKKSLNPPSSLITPPQSVRAQVEEEDPAVDDDDDDGTEALLRNYFNLSLSLSDLYSQWSAADANFRKKAPKFTGVRILNQDAWETVVAFICSSNNNISRISQMVHKLCDHYGGEPIATVAGHVFRDFPGPEALAVPGVEQRLRELGFGYRAKYIAETAEMVAHHKPAGWLLSLRNPASPAWSWPPKDENDAAGIVKTELVKKEEDDEETKTPSSSNEDAAAPSYSAAHAALVELSGVGPKVADCACLMGLGWGEAVPLDTHMLQIAARDYRLDKRTGKCNSMTKGAYDAVGDHFRNIWGPQAGWAQSVLFTANLRAFSDRLKDGGSSTKAVVAKKEEEVEADEKSAKLKVKVEVKEEEEEETAGAGLVSTSQKISETRNKRKAVASVVKTESGADTGVAVKTEVETSVTRRSKRRRV